MYSHRNLFATQTPDVLEKLAIIFLSCTCTTFIANVIAQNQREKHKYMYRPRLSCVSIFLKGVHCTCTSIHILYISRVCVSNIELSHVFTVAYILYRQLILEKKMMMMMMMTLHYIFKSICPRNSEFPQFF